MLVTSHFLIKFSFIFIFLLFVNFRLIYCYTSKKGKNVLCFLMHFVKSLCSSNFINYHNYIYIVKIYHIQNIQNERKIFLIYNHKCVEETKRQMMSCCSYCLNDLFFVWVWGAGENKLSGVSFKEILIPSEVPIFRTSSNHNYLLMAPYLNTITLALGL